MSNHDVDILTIHHRSSFITSSHSSRGLVPLKLCLAVVTILPVEWISTFSALLALGKEVANRMIEQGVNIFMTFFSRRFCGLKQGLSLLDFRIRCTIPV